MQPAASIPPYNEKTLANLIGLTVSVPCGKNRRKNWRMEIKAVRYVSPQSAAVWVLPHSKRDGKGGRWVDLSTVKWRTAVTDPLLLAIHKANER